MAAVFEYPRWFRERYRDRDHGRGRNWVEEIHRPLIRSAVLTLLACVLPVLSACSTTPRSESASAVTTFVIVRHAEKGTDDAKDPSLSEAGRKRAQNLAGLLSRTPLAAAYATGYKRTQQTAQPTADAHAIPVTTYDAQLLAATLAVRLRAAHAHGTVLVVGHSNTVPDLVAALSGTTIEAIRDDQFDRIYRVIIGPDDKSTLAQDTY